MRREWLDSQIETYFDGDAGRGIGEQVADYLITAATIDTLEALDALPVGSIVRHEGETRVEYWDGSWEQGGVAEKRRDASGQAAWFFVGRSLGYYSHQADLLPALLLYMGGPA